MNCGTCKHWNLSAPLGQHGHGTCDARKDPALRVGLSTTAENHCRIASFAKASTQQLQEREKRIGGAP